MGRNGILAQDVIAIAEQLVSKGEIPTIEKVRVILGTGSNSTIAKHLTEWKTLRLKADYKDIIINYAAPDPVNQAVAKVWQQLQEENQAKLEIIEAEATQKIQLIQEEKEQVLEELHQVIKDNQDLRALLKESREQNAALEKDQISLKQDRAVMEAKWQAAEADKNSFQEYATKTLVSIEDKYQQMLNNLEAQLIEKKQQHTEELSQMKERAEAQRHKYIVEIDHLKTQHQRLQTQLSEKDQILVELKTQIKQLNVQIQKQQDNMVERFASLQNTEQQRQAEATHQLEEQFRLSNELLMDNFGITLNKVAQQLEASLLKLAARKKLTKESTQDEPAT